MSDHSRPDRPLFAEEQFAQHFRELRMRKTTEREAREARKAAKKDPRLGPRAPLYRRPATIYFVECDGYVKIGRASKLSSRLSGLKVGSPHTQTLLFTIKGTIGLERELHLRFADHHHSGEWFRIEGSLADFLKNERSQNTACKMEPEECKIVRDQNG